MSKFSRYAFAVLVLLQALPQARAEEQPIITPYPGSSGGRNSAKEFDEFNMPVGPAGKKAPQPMKRVEGRVSIYSYGNPPNRSGLEIFRNYQKALQQASFQPIFTCEGWEACGELWRAEPFSSGSTTPRYVAAKLARTEGDVFAGIYVDDKRHYIVTIQTKGMETGRVKVSAEALSGDILREGHAAIYGIYFDTNEATLKPESAPVLDEIAKLLRQNEALKVIVIGHTDNVGDFAYNLKLSQQRADAVVRELVSKYKIVQTRLRAGGVGMQAPVATNRTEEGRAKNRRVELVEQ